MTQLNISLEHAKLHLAILGKRELYHLVAKNHQSGKVINAWLKENQIIAWALEKNNEGLTCWVSLNDKEDANDSIEGIRALNVFWLDIDSKRNDKTTPATEGQLKESLQRAQNLKSLIETECLAEGFLACSGNGFHLFFPLPRFELLGEGFRREINHKVKLFAKKASAKVNAQIDSTYDIRRVTTLIGSFNLKIAQAPLKTCWRQDFSTGQVEQARSKNRALLETILNTKEENQEPSNSQSQTNHPVLDELLMEDAKLSDLFGGNWQKYGYKSRSEAEQAVVTKLVLKGLNDSEIDVAMQSCGIGKWREKEQSYRALSIEHARKHAKTNKPPISDGSRQEQETKDKGKEKPKLHKASGYAEEGYYESIYFRSKPAFLTLNGGVFRVCQEVTAENEAFLPKEYPNEFPYEPYSFFEGSVPSREELFWKVREEFNLFLDLESIWKDYLAAFTLLSYLQEKTRTVPYVYFVGDNESGKTVALNLLNWLCYRPMLGVTIPSADTYGYLDESEAPGVILEDEAQGLYKDLDKAKIYKAGYKQGAVVPRTMLTQNKRFIKYFRVFCLKACAAEEMPHVKGLLERFIFIPMTEGYPRKDWADVNKEDETRLRELRNMLLKWRLAAHEWELPEVKLPVKGRLKELWKPIIQIVSGLAVEKDLRAQLEYLQKERLSEKTNTLEGHIVKVVCELYTSDEPLIFTDVWDALVKDLDGKLDDKKPNKVDTPEFGEVTKQKIGYRLREVLGGKKAKAVGHANDRVYVFDSEKLGRIAKKYGCIVADKQTTKTSSAGVSASKDESQVDENRLVSEKTPNLGSEETGKQVQAPVKVVQLVHSSANLILEDLIGKTKSVGLLPPRFGVENCVICGVKCESYWQFTLFDESWGFLCGPCGQKLSDKLSSHD